MEFQAFGKIPRLRREVVITEKIDGTNACVIVDSDGTVGAQSRKRIITPEDDNYGFARWVRDNEQFLKETLGPGHHFGEWWGRGINRNYGMEERVFSLFNTARWGDLDGDPIAEAIGLRVVPVVVAGGSLFDVDWAIGNLREHGSRAAPGFSNPEGVVVFHTASNSLFKVTCEDDEVPKGMARAA